MLNAYIMLYAQIILIQKIKPTETLLEVKKVSKGTQPGKTLKIILQKKNRI